MAFLNLTLQEKQFKENSGLLAQLVRENKAIIQKSGSGQIEVIMTDLVTFEERLTCSAHLCLEQGFKGLIFQAVKGYQDRITRKEQSELQKKLFDYFDQRKHQLIEMTKKDLANFILEKNNLDMTGFLRFSALDLKRWIKETAAYEVIRIIDEREQAEFIQVLRFFVNIQEPLAEEAHLIIDSQGEFTLQDEAGQDLKASYLASLPDDDISSISKEDLIMSMLVTLIPKKIVIHLHDQANVPGLDVIGAVFAERLTVCAGADQVPLNPSSYMGAKNP